ncbi:MAG: bifunctional methylenetetrahydrofolate dehydrogenase/methenyltetrahydrofolate cyclohydrolase FolD [Candidatus Caenarcaniphilales bacterium]|nr:bifunctional methylenetetrahydrofolate dehydrogenase/methenyltetrahydrofolate cyclohydrolase FolD [Candidatus Caenarcaniphilales bacterium]
MSEAVILDGKAIAANLRNCLKHKVAKLIEDTGKAPSLAVILVGDHPPSQVYVNNKQKAAHEVGLKATLHHLPSSTSQNELEHTLKKLNEDPAVNAILLQLPLPKGLMADPLLLTINPLKDADGLHPFNLGLIMAGAPNLIPCTPYGIMQILKAYNLDPKGKRALVIGRSRLVGRPITELLLNAHATVAVAHSHTSEEDLRSLLIESDLVIGAVGKPGFIRGDWLKQGCVAIDVGINRLPDGKLVGDFAYEECLPKVAAITPVPGGVGPLTVAHLLLNTVKAFEIQCFGHTHIEL